MSSENFDVLAELIEVAGEPAALDLVREYGGQTIYLPSRARPDDWLSACVGFQAAEAICSYYRVSSTGIRLLIPKGDRLLQSRRRIEIRKLLSEGVGVRAISAKLKIHERTVYRHRAATKRKKAVKSA